MRPSPAAARALLALWGLLLTVAGCPESELHTCDFGVVCPAAMVCDEVTQSCVFPGAAVCGDGLVDDGEECDDGADNDDTVPDACRSNCRLARCGDGVQDVGEACDNGNTTSGDGCSGDCRSDETCGNGVVDDLRGERCDDGADNSDAPDATCRADCTFAFCGDGVVDPASGEVCEPGEVLATRCQDLGFYQGPSQLTCSDSCQLDTSACSGRCGDGIKQPEETCDPSADGSIEGVACVDLGYYEGQLACTQFCTLDTSGCSRQCGDGILDPEETCDTLPPATQSCVGFGFDKGALGCNKACAPSFATCALIDWRPVSSFPVAAASDAWSPAPHEWWVLSGQQLLHGVGADLLETIALDPTWTARSLWGSVSPSGIDVWIVGDGGRIVRFDGATLSDVASPVDATLSQVRGLGPDDVWAVGGFSVLRWRGTQWEVALDTGLDTQVSRVAVAGHDDVWVGNNSRVFHTAGATLQPMPLDAPSPSVAALWAAGPHDVWAITRDTTREVMTLHRNGDQGRLIPRFSAKADWGTGLALLFVEIPISIGGWAADDVWFATSGVAVHYDGVNFGTADVPLLRPGGALMPTAPGEVLSLAHTEDPAPLAFRSGGQSRLSTAGTVGSPISALRVAADGALVVGTVDTGIWSFADGAWTQEAAGPKQILDLWRGDDGTMVAVDNQLRVWTRGAGGEWTPNGLTDINADFWFGQALAAHILGPHEIWGMAVDLTSQELVRRYDGSTWEVIPSPLEWDPTKDDAAVWAGQGEAWVALEGELLHYDGSQWEAHDPPGGASVRGLYGDSPNELWAIGSLGELLRLQGGAWSLRPSALPPGLRVIDGVDQDIWIGGAAGALATLHDDGPEPVRLTQTADVTALAIDGRSVWMGRSDGTVARLLRHEAVRCEALETRCSDRVDDDCDGLRDACDPDCGPPPKEVCDNGIDDDCDGLADACDPECDAEEVCGNGRDDDCNGWVDGCDEACPGAEICGNGVDDDCDGRADCDGEDCLAHASCLGLGACQGHEPIRCGDLVKETTPGGTSLDNQACGPGGDIGSEGGVGFGSERFYHLVLPDSGAATLQVSSQSGLAFIFTRPAETTGGCTPNSCSAWGGKQALVTGPPGSVHYVVVDTHLGPEWGPPPPKATDPVSFALSMTCD